MKQILLFGKLLLFKHPLKKGLKENTMTPRRIQELIQILWDEVNSAEDLQKFLAAYGNEIDGDFLTDIAER